ncbi:hypothetical protein CR513_21214, partial [Mucuna pruriens]
MVSKEEDEETNLCFTDDTASKGEDNEERSFKPFKTNKKRPKRIWVPKNMIILVAYLLDSRKKTTIMVPRHWLLMSHNGRKNNLYKINLRDLTNQSVTCLVCINNDQWTWHKKLGHPSLRLISKLKKHNLIKRLPSLLYKAKFYVMHVKKGNKSSKLLHIDLFGPTRIVSMSEKRYGLVKVDDYYRWTWVISSFLVVSTHIK